MKELLEKLESLPKGPIKGKSKFKIEPLIIQNWDEFSGSSDGGMNADKLIGRIENLNWDPPILSFIIERHGSIVVGGSTRAEKQKWELNTENRTALFSITGYRQTKPKQKKLDVKLIAEDTAKLIVNKEKHERLRWSEDGSVYIQIGKIIPEDSSFKQTVVNRRKRFRKELDEILEKKGWQKLGNNHYKKAN